MWRTIESPRPSPPWRRIVPSMRLLERLEHVRQERRHRSRSRCRRPRSRCGTPRAPSVTCTLPPLGVNLIALDSRFHITCCRRSESPEIMPARSSSTTCSRICLASLAGRCDSIAARITGSRSIGRTSSRNLPETTRETSTRSSISCRQGGDVALDDLEPALGLLAVERAAAEQLRPGEDRRERIAQLVRDGRQELVLQLARRLGLEERGRGPALPFRGDEARARLPAPGAIDEHEEDAADDQDEEDGGRGDAAQGRRREHRGAAAHDRQQADEDQPAIEHPRIGPPEHGAFLTGTAELRGARPARDGPGQARTRREQPRRVCGAPADKRRLRAESFLPPGHASCRRPGAAIRSGRTGGAGCRGS